MAHGTSKLKESEPSAVTGRSQQARLTYYPVFSQSNERMACCPCLVQAANKSHPECVEWHLKQGGCLPKLLRHQHARVQRPLHEAAGAKSTNDGHSSTPQCTVCVRKLLAAGLQASWLDENGRSSLERAAMVGCVPCIEALLRAPTSANMDAVCAQQSAALVEAARINSEASVRALLGQASASAASVERLAWSESRLGPALVEAVEAGAYECINPLVKAGAVLSAVRDASDGSCRPVLLIAAAGREGTVNKQKDDRAPDVVRLLVKLGADVNAQEPSSGQTALHMSASKGRCDCVQVFLELGADPMVLDHCGNSSLHEAASCHHVEACRLLVNHISEASGTAAAAAALLAKNKMKRSPLHSAASRGCWETGSEAASCLSMLLSLLKASGGSQAVAGALREKIGDKGRTIVHFAVGGRHIGCLKALLGTPEGFEVALKVEDDDGTTPIALARKAGHDVDNIPAFTHVPFVPCCSNLVESTEKGHVACVKHILKDGCPATQVDSVAEGEDLDPLSSPMSHDGYSCSKIVRLLLEAGFHPDGCHGDYVPLRVAADVDSYGGDLCVECTRLLIEAGAGGLLIRWSQHGDSAMWFILSHASDNADDDEAMSLAKTALATFDMKDDKLGVTDLCDWAGRRNTKLPRLLVDAGADMKAENRFGQTVLHMAAGLLDLYLEEEEEEEEDDLRDSDQHTELVGWLVSKGAVVDARDNYGNTPMHTAAGLGLSKVVAVLLDRGADPLLQNTNGYTSLHMAAQAGCTTLMARFIDLGIDVGAKADNGNTALHLVSQQGRVSGVRMLLDEGADIDQRNENGWTPLRHAATNNKVEALECLLDVGKGDHRQRLHNVGNLLHTAAYHGSLAVMKLLVKRGLDVDSTIVSNGETVMHNAALNGGGLSVKWLLDNGASLDVQDHQGRKPPTCAVGSGPSDQNVRSALEAIAGSEDGKSSMSVVWHGRGLLHLAAAKGFAHCVQFLVSKGAEIDCKSTDGEGQTAMHCAASSMSDNRSGVIRVLAKFGACVDALDFSGQTPLHLAAVSDGQLEIATMLLELGASCNIADNGGRTPLLAAAKNGNLACCSLLVARGADMALRDTQGKSALGASLAGLHSTKAKREVVMKLLIDLGCAVREAEVDAASRGGLTDSFAKAVTARMNGGTAARELVKTASMAFSSAGGWAAAEDVGEDMPDSGSASSNLIVRVSSEPPPTFSSRRSRRVASAGEVITSSKVYHIDSLRLRLAVSHLEGPDEVGKCVLLKLLLPPPAGWASVYRGDSGGQGGGSSTGLADGQTQRPGYTLSDSVLLSHRGPRTLFMYKVELSCNGDDFDEAGFEAMLEYLSTGQVVGATLGNIHGDFSASDNGARHKVGARAVACHRAAAFFGLPRLQKMVRAWLKANGAEMEDDGTGVLSEPADESSGDVSRKRKFAGEEHISSKETEELGEQVQEQDEAEEDDEEDEEDEEHEGEEGEEEEGGF